MTVAEKKQLYRASFANTFAEQEAPEGLWKLYVGAVAFGIGTAMLLFTGMIIFGKYGVSLAGCPLAGHGRSCFLGRSGETCRACVTPKTLYAISFGIEKKTLLSVLF